MIPKWCSLQYHKFNSLAFDHNGLTCSSALLETNLRTMQSSDSLTSPPSLSLLLSLFHPFQIPKFITSCKYFRFLVSFFPLCLPGQTSALQRFSHLLWSFPITNLITHLQLNSSSFTLERREVGHCPIKGYPFHLWSGSHYLLSF